MPRAVGMRGAIWLDGGEGIHSAAKLVAALPDGTVEFGFLDGHAVE